MACKNCQTIRDLILHGKMADAMGLTVETLREKIGFKVIEPDSTVEGLRYSVAIDADADHWKAIIGGGAPEITPVPPSLSGKTKAELLEIAALEEVSTEEGATNAEIIEAIESKRRGLA